MPYGDIRYRDNRSGRFRRADTWEKNKFFDTDTLSKGLANFRFKTQNQMGEYAAEFAADLVSYAKENAPWDDRTGTAREGLTSEVTLENDSLEITLAHTAEYGIWLEIRWSGKYAIIIPSIETMGARLYDRMSDMLSEIVYYA